MICTRNVNFALENDVNQQKDAVAMSFSLGPILVGMVLLNGYLNKHFIFKSLKPVATTIITIISMTTLGIQMTYMRNLCTLKKLPYKGNHCINLIKSMRALTKHHQV